MWAFDLYSLKFIFEIKLKYIDNDFPPGGYDDSNDKEYNNFSSKFPTSECMNNPFCLNQAEYVIWPISRFFRCAVYYWKVYDTKTGKIRNLLERKGALKQLITDFKVDIDDSEWIYFITRDPFSKLIVGKINILNGEETIICNINLNIEVKNAQFDLSLKNLYIECISEHDHPVVYKYDINDRIGLEPTEYNFRKLR